MTKHLEELRGAHGELAAAATGYKVRLRHFVPDYVLYAYALDVLEQAGLVASTTDVAYGRALIANSRAAFESALDMLLLTADPAKYNENGSWARTTELVEIEQLHVRRDAAIAKLQLDARPALFNAEEAIEQDAVIWEEECPGARTLLRSCLSKVRDERRWRKHWSGLSRKEQAKALDSAYSDQSGFAEMIDSTYGILSVHSHPRPRIGSRSSDWVNGQLTFTPKESDLQVAWSVSQLAARFAVRSIQQRAP